ncbi:hypothetical protein [Tateyamaria omphalii]|uniref:hypothetical protein n=1 Tax=Tateyamaria omphalii TaxID=299262 RepID=UPI001E531E40|nr:hypothetical protein [Tateyamaria omphalii]
MSEHPAPARLNEKQNDAGEMQMIDKLAHLVGRRLEQHGCVLSDWTACEQKMRMDEGTDVTILLAGLIRMAWQSGFVAHIRAPAVILSTDITRVESVVVRDIRLLNVDLDKCCSMMRQSPEFRDLFRVACSSRIKTLRAMQHPITMQAVH